jgi:hypothetical protein
VNVGVLEEEYSYGWASMCPTFAIPEKDGTIKVFTNFRNHNSLLKGHQFPIPKIGKADMIRSMEGFTFSSALDLNMGYYQIKRDAESQKICTIIFQCHMVKYKYK